jgi:hypothetical protein
LEAATRAESYVHCHAAHRRLQLRRTGSSDQCASTRNGEASRGLSAGFGCYGTLAVNCSRQTCSITIGRGISDTVSLCRGGRRFTIARYR